MSPKPALLQYPITLTARYLLRPVPAPCLLSEGSWLEVDFWWKISFLGDNKSITYFRKITWLQLYHFCQYLWSSYWVPLLCFWWWKPYLHWQPASGLTEYLQDVSILIWISPIDPAINSLISWLASRQLNVCWSWNCNLCSVGFLEGQAAVLSPRPFSKSTNSAF